MEPALHDGQFAVFSPFFRLRNRDVVLFGRENKMEYVKRLHVRDHRWDLQGDNSGDSRDFLDVSSNQIIGRLVCPRLGRGR